jgi:hypothetical protein
LFKLLLALQHLDAAAVELVDALPAAQRFQLVQRQRLVAGVKLQLELRRR